MAADSAGRAGNTSTGHEHARRQVRVSAGRGPLCKRAQSHKQETRNRSMGRSLKPIMLTLLGTFHFLSMVQTMRLESALASLALVPAEVVAQRLYDSAQLSSSSSQSYALRTSARSAEDSSSSSSAIESGTKDATLGRLETDAVAILAQTTTMAASTTIVSDATDRYTAKIMIDRMTTKSGNPTALVEFGGDSNNRTNDNANNNNNNNNSHRIAGTTSFICNRETEFHCRAENRCIPLEWRCDFTEQCLDGEDELLCAPKRCDFNQEQCHWANEAVSWSGSARRRPKSAATSRRRTGAESSSGGGVERARQLAPVSWRLYHHYGGGSRQQQPRRAGKRFADFLVRLASQAAGATGAAMDLSPCNRRPLDDANGAFRCPWPSSPDRISRYLFAPIHLDTISRAQQLTQPSSVKRSTSRISAPTIGQTSSMCSLEFKYVLWIEPQVDVSVKVSENGARSNVDVNLDLSPKGCTTLKGAPLELEQRPSIAERSAPSGTGGGDQQEADKAKVAAKERLTNGSGDELNGRRPEPETVGQKAAEEAAAAATEAATEAEAEAEKNKLANSRRGRTAADTGAGRGQRPVRRRGGVAIGARRGLVRTQLRLSLLSTKLVTQESPESNGVGGGDGGSNGGDSHVNEPTDERDSAKSKSTDAKAETRTLWTKSIERWCSFRFTDPAARRAASGGVISEPNGFRVERKRAEEGRAEPSGSLVRTQVDIEAAPGDLGAHKGIERLEDDEDEWMIGVAELGHLKRSQLSFVAEASLVFGDDDDDDDDGDDDEEADDDDDVNDDEIENANATKDEATKLGPETKGPKCAQATPTTITSPRREPKTIKRNDNNGPNNDNERNVDDCSGRKQALRRVARDQSRRRRRRLVARTVVALKWLKFNHCHWPQGAPSLSLTIGDDDDDDLDDSANADDYNGPSASGSPEWGGIDLGQVNSGGDDGADSDGGGDGADTEFDKTLGRDKRSGPANWSAETTAEQCTGPNRFRCSNGICLKRRKLCNFVDDCMVEFDKGRADKGNNNGGGDGAVVVVNGSGSNDNNNNNDDGSSNNNIGHDDNETGLARATSAPLSDASRTAERADTGNDDDDDDETVVFVGLEAEDERSDLCGAVLGRESFEESGTILRDWAHLFVASAAAGLNAESGVSAPTPLDWTPVLHPHKDPMGARSGKPVRQAQNSTTLHRSKSGEAHEHFKLATAGKSGAKISFWRPVLGKWPANSVRLRSQNCNLDCRIQLCAGHDTEGSCARAAAACDADSGGGGCAAEIGGSDFDRYAPCRDHTTAQQGAQGHYLSFELPKTSSSPFVVPPGNGPVQQQQHEHERLQQQQQHHRRRRHHHGHSHSQQRHHHKRLASFWWFHIDTPWMHRSIGGDGDECRLKFFYNLVTDARKKTATSMKNLPFNLFIVLEHFSVEKWADELKRSVKRHIDTLLYTTQTPPTHLVALPGADGNAERAFSGGGGGADDDQGPRTGAPTRTGTTQFEPIELAGVDFWREFNQKISSNDLHHSNELVFFARIVVLVERPNELNSIKSSSTPQGQVADAANLNNGHDLNATLNFDDLSTHFGCKLLDQQLVERHDLNKYKNHPLDPNDYIKTTEQSPVAEVTPAQDGNTAAAAQRYHRSKSSSAGRASDTLMHRYQARDLEASRLFLYVLGVACMIIFFIAVVVFVAVPHVERVMMRQAEQVSISANGNARSNGSDSGSTTRIGSDANNHLAVIGGLSCTTNQLHRRRPSLPLTRSALVSRLVRDLSPEISSDGIAFGRATSSLQRYPVRANSNKSVVRFADENGLARNVVVTSEMNYNGYDAAPYEDPKSSHQNQSSSTSASNRSDAAPLTQQHQRRLAALRRLLSSPSDSETGCADHERHLSEEEDSHQMALGSSRTSQL